MALPAAAAEVLFAADVDSAAVDSRGRSDTTRSLALNWFASFSELPTPESACLWRWRQARLLDGKMQPGCVLGETRPRYALAHFVGVSHLWSFWFFNRAS